MVFLEMDEVVAIHDDQITRYGGTHGIRDVGLLASAIAMPKASFGRSYLHETVHEMAAAYLYHLVQNHPFFDGNKRTGLMAAIVFLGMNDLTMIAEQDQLTDLVFGIAQGQVSKSDIAVFLKHHTEQR